MWYNYKRTKFSFENFLWRIYAKQYDGLLKYHEQYKKLVYNVTNIMNYNLKNENQKILDAGCGTGNFTMALAEEGFTAIGIDRSDAMLKMASGKVCAVPFRDRCNFILADIEGEFAFSRGKRFDGAIAIHSFYTLRDKSSFLARVYDILNDGGIFIICDPSRRMSAREILKESLFSLKKELKSGRKIQELASIIAGMIIVTTSNILIQRMKKNKFRCFNRTELIDFLISAGFKIISAEESCLNNSHVFIVAQKQKELPDQYKNKGIN
ncbi:MAG TPA: class I SAM-dependent methyltransferase [bacterium]